MITLRAVLAEINQDVRNGEPHYFALAYVKKDGSTGSKLRVRKSGTTQEKAGGSNFKYKVKEKGVLLLWDELEGRHFAVKIALLTHYNGKEVRH